MVGVVYWIHLPGHNIKTNGYVGITKDYKQRIMIHKSRAKHRYGSCPILERAISKYADELVYDIVFEGDIECCALIEAELRDKECIGWNVALGGANLPMYGRHHTDEAKAKISKSQKGCLNSRYGKNSEYQKLKASEANLGRVRTDEEKQKVSIARKGVYARGKNGTAKKVICLNTGYIFDCALDASEWCGLKNATSICKFCREHNMEYAGRHPETKEKLQWQYLS